MWRVNSISYLKNKSKWLKLFLEKSKQIKIVHNSYINPSLVSQIMPINYLISILFFIWS